MIVRSVQLMLAIGSALMIALPSGAQAWGWAESSVMVDGLERWYRVYSPASLPKNAPAVVLLHGGTESMRKLFKPSHPGAHEWKNLADRHKFLLLVPNGTNSKTGDAKGDNQNWNDLRSEPDEMQSQADDVSFIRALLDKIEAEHSIDNRRVYVTGASNGGIMTYRLLIEMPERFAAGAVFIAHHPRETNRLHKPAQAVPLMMLSGTLDPIMKYNGGEIMGGRGNMRSAQETLNWWLHANRANAQNAQIETLPDSDPNDGCRIERTRYPALPGGAPVVFYRAEGGGHTTPTLQPVSYGRLIQRLIGPTCQDAEGAEFAWEFLNHFKTQNQIINYLD